MDYKKLSEINEKLKAVSTPFQKGGKVYVEVCKRIQGFWELFPNGRIITEFVDLTGEYAICRAMVYDGEIWLTTGTAREDKGTTFINKTNYVENAETSAVGRALGNLGIGSVDSIATYEDVQHAEAPKAPEPKKRSSKAAPENKKTVRRQFVDICMEYGLSAGEMSKSFNLVNTSTDEDFQNAIESIKKMFEGAN